MLQHVDFADNKLVLRFVYCVNAYFANVIALPITYFFCLAHLILIKIY